MIDRSIILFWKYINNLKTHKLYEISVWTAALNSRCVYCVLWTIIHYINAYAYSLTVHCVASMVTNWRGNTEGDNWVPVLNESLQLLHVWYGVHPCACVYILINIHETLQLLDLVATVKNVAPTTMTIRAVPLTLPFDRWLLFVVYFCNPTIHTNLFCTFTGFF